MNDTPSFPKISELPKLINSSDWSWQKPHRREDERGIDADWWIGTAPEGRKWLVKMTNGFHAYREHVFASLAQSLGISCQSSAYLLIESDSAEPRIHSQFSEPYQLALWFMDEHENKSCSAICPWQDYSTSCMSGDYLRIRQADVAGVTYFEDLVRGDVLGYLCGQFEPHDHFLTSQHEYVIIDNELMFSAPGVKPSLHGCRWLNADVARPVAIDVCRGLVSLTDDALRKISEIPEGFDIPNGRDLYHDLCDAKAVASTYIQEFQTVVPQNTSG